MPSAAPALSLGTESHGQESSPELQTPDEESSSDFSPDASEGTAQLTSRTGWALASDTWGNASEGTGFPTAQRLSEHEWQRIRDGWTVSKKLTFSYQGRTYVGGVAHQIIRAESVDVLSSLLDENQIREALPLTKEARVIDRDHQGVEMELVQGNSLAEARYTVRLTRDSDEALRLSLVKGRNSSVRDVLGYVTATPFTDTHALVTIAVGVDLGSSLKRALFQSHVQKAAVSAPAHMRRFLEGRSRSWTAPVKTASL
jgi:hypothetical protein